MKKLLKNNKGESFIETLAATLIIVLVITGFSGVVANVVEVNQFIKEKRTTFNKNKEGIEEVYEGWTFEIYETQSSSVLPYVRNNNKVYPYVAPDEKAIIMSIDKSNDLKSYSYGNAKNK